MEVRAVQEVKADSPMELTEVGMVIEAIWEQKEKALVLMVMTEVGMVMEVRDSQPPNVPNSLSPSLMEITEVGMVTELKAVHTEKEAEAMEVTEVGIVTEVREVQD